MIGRMPFLAAQSDERPAPAMSQRALLIEAAKLRAHYRDMPAAVVGSVFIGAFMGMVLQQGAGWRPVLYWFAAVLIQAVIRYTIYRKFNSSDPPLVDMPRWGLFAVIGCAVSGMVWGLAGLLLYVPDGLNYQFFLAMGLLGVSSASLYATTSFLPAFFAFLYPGTLLAAVPFFMESDAMHFAVGLLILMYLPFTTRFALSYHRSFLESIKLRFENIELIDALRKRKDAAEEANIAKSRFLAAASHDLRQPLHALGLFVQALQDSPLQDYEKRMVANVRRSVDSMEELFNALLDISRLDAGVVQPRMTSIPLSTVLERVFFEYEPVARQKGLRLRLAPTTVMVYSDVSLLERIIRNLVVNAVRYTDKGGIVMGCRRRGNRVRIEVWDSGRGIPAGQRLEIFREFYRLQDRDDNQHKGLGLGLAIVDRLARLLDHYVDVQSNVGRGSVFALTVPRGVQEHWLATDVVATAEPTMDLARRRVLVIDDDHSVLEGMATLLRGWHCDVVTASTGEEMRAKLPGLRSVPDLIVSDYRLQGDSNGIEVIEMLREEFNKDIPALLITADTAAERVRDAEANGLPILHKPLNPKRLRQLIQHLLRPQTHAAA